jgi:3-oxoacyl-[acyl-carrier protein] reductase
MDMGIRGKTALVCASSKGLGRACAFSLAHEGANLVITARGKEALEKTAEEIRAATGVKVIAVASDIATEAGRAAVLAACPQPDILVNNAGDTWIAALDMNMIAPIEMIKATVDHMIAHKFGRIVNITSSTVKAPIETLGLSNGARAGLTGFIAGIARKTVAHNVTINNLLPGPFDTDRLRSNFALLAKNRGVSVDVVREERMKQNPSGRLGDPAEFGDACAYLCSAQAGFVTGQNFLIDGGGYPGTF